MSAQRERVELLASRLVNTELARRQAVRNGNTKLHNDLANMNREAIGEALPADLRSLVTTWMFRLADEVPALVAEIERLRTTLHEIATHAKERAAAAEEVGDRFEASLTAIANNARQSIGGTGAGL